MLSHVPGHVMRTPLTPSNPYSRATTMSDLDDEQELLVVMLHQPTPPDSKLARLVAQNSLRTGTPLRKVLEYLRLAVLRQTNRLESYVMKTEPNDCSLVAKFSKVVDIDLKETSLSVSSVAVSATHIPHPLVKFVKNGGDAKLKELAAEVEELPIFVFVHGLGGQMTNFEPLMGLLCQCLEVMAIDLPGFGTLRRGNGKLITEFSEDEQTRLDQSWRSMLWADFETDKIVEILQAWIKQQVSPNKKIVLIGHLMGTALVIKLAGKLPPKTVEGMILLSPPALANTQAATKYHTPPAIKFFSYFPRLFSLFRIWDRLDGLDLHLVLRHLTKASSANTKLKQLRWNMDVESPVVLRYMLGFHKATFDELARAVDQYNDKGITPQTTNQKTLVMCGAEDGVTPRKCSIDIVDFLNRRAQREVATYIEIGSAGHSLLLSKPEFVSGTVLGHIEKYYPERLHISPTWVLKVKAKVSGDKWGLKNEQKWRNTLLISGQITRPGDTVAAPFLAMKTLKEGDADHLPQLLEAKFYGSPRTAPVDGDLVAVIDISLDVPVYNPELFSIIKYYKCATVSKVVPDKTAIRRFIAIVDEILASTSVEHPMIGVHCHYGQNRTIFCCCCYLIERLGWSIDDALEAFAIAKPPGIKHPHFIDALYVRYQED